MLLVRSSREQPRHPERAGVDEFDQHADLPEVAMARVVAEEMAPSAVEPEDAGGEHEARGDAVW